MLISGELDALNFERINIIEFFKRYKELDADFSLSKSEVMKRVS